MKASRFSDAKKAFILEQGADGILVADYLPQGRHLQIERLRHLTVCRNRDAPAQAEPEDKNGKPRMGSLI